MLTLFTVPKPFTGDIGMTQRNALASWSRLGAGCEVLVFGDEVGTADAARDAGARHIAAVACNDRGTPLLSDVFAQAADIARHPILVFVNADIILTADLLRAVAQVAERPRFLLCGRRWNLSITAPLVFDDGWEARLRDAVARDGELAIPGAIDYFVYPRRLFGTIPPFAIGRSELDQWLLFRARALGGALIDATASVLAVHQNHDYAHLVAMPRAVVEEEVARNRDLALFHRLDLRDATHLLTENGVTAALDAPHLRRRLLALPKFYLPNSAPVRALYGFWRQRVRGLYAPGGLRAEDRSGDGAA